MTTVLDRHDDVVRRFAEACRTGRAVAVAGIGTANGKVSMLWIVLNPAKLGGWHRP
jgi:hypothetical protein